MSVKSSEEKALAQATKGPRAECRRICRKIRRQDLGTGHDPEAPPARLERVLAHVEDHFWQPSLTVASACQAAGVEDHNTGSLLSSYCQHTLSQLVEKLRIDTAEHLLVETRIKTVTIGHLVGFRTYSTFLRAYKTWTGESPLKTRERHGIHPYAGVPFDFGNARLLRRMDAGDLVGEELSALQDGLRELYPAVFGETVPAAGGAGTVPLALDAEALERFYVAELWPGLAGLPFAEQRRTVRAWIFSTPAPFRFLTGKAREEGRRDRKRGVEVARLALDALDGNEERLGSRVHELRAEGWAWLANAQRLDLDFDAAEASFGRAEGLLDAHDLRDAWVAGLFHLAKGTLRMFQRRHDETFDLFDQALPPFESAGDVHFQVRTLLQRVATLNYANRFDEVEPALRRAEALLQTAPDDGLSFQIAYAAVSSLARSGDSARAEASFQSLAAKVATVEEPVWLHLIQWAEALVDHGLGRFAAAEEKYLSSRRGFQSLHQARYEAFLVLDLAVLYAEIGDSAKVLEICPAICRFFEGLQLYDETLAGLQLLRAAMARAEVTTDLLKDIRSRLCQDPLATCV